MTLLNMDPPKHNRYRRLVSAGFTPRMISACSTSDRASGPGAIVDDVEGRDEIEFVEDGGRRAAAAGDLRDDRRPRGGPAPHASSWSNRLVGFHDPDFQATEEDGQHGRRPRSTRYCDAIAADRRANPRDDIMTALVQAEVDGDRLTDQELNMFFVLLVRGRQRDHPQPDRRTPCSP